MLTYLIRGIGYGFAAAMQPGQFQAYLMAQTLRQGWRKTLPLIFAPLLSDGPVIVIVLFALSRLPVWWLQVLRFAGGLFALYLAAGTFRAWRNFRPVQENPSSGVYAVPSLHSSITPEHPEVEVFGPQGSSFGNAL